MIAILPAPPHLAAFRFDGLLSGEDFDVCVGEVERRLATQPRINLFCDMEVHFITHFNSFDIIGREM